MSSQDAQLIEANQMTVEAITSVFGVPLALVNSMGSSTYNNTEQLINHWLSTDLGHTIKLIETAFENFFETSSSESINFDEKILLRTNMKDRLETYGQGVLRGIYSPNEVRQLEGLGPVEGGDKPYMQQQMVPVGENPIMDTPASDAKEPADPADAIPAKDPAATKAMIKAILIGKMHNA